MLKTAVAIETVLKVSVELRGNTKTEAPVNSLDVGKKDMDPNNAILKINTVEKNSPGKPSTSKKKGQGVSKSKSKVIVMIHWRL